ncbi:unnamed protein product [Cunninghamella blakesleeana]
MDNLVPNVSTYWRFSKGDSYYCDWRLTLTYCEGDNIFHYLYIVNIVLTAIAVILGYGLLYHRLVVLNQVIFEYRDNFIRPRAMESILFFVTLFNTVRLIQITILFTDTVQNIILRQFLFEFGYELGFTTLTTYLYGITYTLKESDEVLFEQWVKSPRYVDISCTLIIVAPFITNTISSLGAGISAYYGNHQLAYIFTQVLYIIWAVHCIITATLTLVSGIRLIHILEKHIKRKKDLNSSIDLSKIELGCQKVKIIAFTSSICLYMYTGVSLTYGIVRYQIHTSLPWNLFFCISWNVLGLMATYLIAFAAVVNPKMKLTLLFGSSYQRSQDSTNGGGLSGKFSKKGHNTNNTTLADSTMVGGSTFETTTFEYGNEFSNDENKKLENMAPTLSTAAAMKLNNHHHSNHHHNPMMYNDTDQQDVTLSYIYPQSHIYNNDPSHQTDFNESSTQLVGKHHY